MALSPRAVLPCFGFAAFAPLVSERKVRGVRTYVFPCWIMSQLSKKALPVKPRPTEKESTASNSDIRRFTKIPDEHMYVNLNKKICNRKIIDPRYN